MPTLTEDIPLYMPVTLPGLSVATAAELSQTLDPIICSFRAVESVRGTSGGAAMATDPAAIEMVGTTINLKPESSWHPGVTADSLSAGMDGRGAAAARGSNRLAPADQGADRRPVDRYPDADRRHGARTGPGGRRAGLARRGGCGADDAGTTNALAGSTTLCCCRLPIPRSAAW